MYYNQVLNKYPDLRREIITGTIKGIMTINGYCISLVGSECPRVIQLDPYTVRIYNIVAFNKCKYLTLGTYYD